MSDPGSIAAQFDARSKGLAACEIVPFSYEQPRVSSDCLNDEMGRGDLRFNPWQRLLATAPPSVYNLTKTFDNGSVRTLPSFACLLHRFYWRW